ncbi:MAG: phosphoenolpyruvate--protein phosphotransferase [Frankiaceae bacterium]
MDDLQGVGVSAGIGVGPALRVVDTVPEPPSGANADDPDTEAQTALTALEAVAVDLDDRGQRAGGEAQEVLEAQAMMARDPSLAEDIRSRTKAGATAARATYDAFGAFREILAGAGDYLAARVADLDDIRDRAVARLLGIAAPGVPQLGSPVVLIARDLAPADTALLDPTLVRAFVTEQGGPTAHTAILARTLGVPAVVACPGATAIPDGVSVLVDGGTGAVRIDPSDSDVSEALAKADRLRAALAGASSGPGATADGYRVSLYANVGGPADVPAAVAAGAEGVGLFRTELSFLDRSDAPTEDEQAALYGEVLSGFPGKRVVVRVLDAGADKPLPFLPHGEEPNPALGVRGLRILQAQPDILRTQLGALRRAAAETGAELAVMAPMVADAAEAAWFAAACREAGLPGPVGVMVEIPSAALRAREILGAVDFLSIGSNDLAQYAFAADRQVGAVAHLQDPWQPALLDLIAGAAEAARAAEQPCGVCGEAAADPALGCVLVGLGVTSLSMTAGAIAGVLAALGAHTTQQCAAAAAAARAASSAADARAAARSELPELAALGL